MPPTFDELVGRAETVFVGRVVDVRSALVSSRYGRHIVTDVTFAVERTLMGTPRAQQSLEFLGGTVGEETLVVARMPRFHIGDRDVLFVTESGRPVSPIVGFMYGRFRIVPDPTTGVDTLRTHDGRPLGALDQIGNCLPPARLAPARTVTLDEFAAAVGGPPPRVAAKAMKRSTLIPLLVLAGCLAATSASAYFLLVDEWPNGPIVIHLELGPAPPLSDGSADWDESAARALATWNASIRRGWSSTPSDIRACPTAMATE